MKKAGSTAMVPDRAVYYAYDEVRYLIGLYARTCTTAGSGTPMGKISE